MKVYNALGQLEVTQYNGVIQNAKRTIFFSLAGGWTTTTDADGGYLTVETATNKVNFKGTKFMASTSNMVHEFGIPMPDNYDGGTITAKPYMWTSSNNVSNNTIIFGLQGVSYGNEDAMDAAYGTAQESTTTVVSSIANKVIIGAATPAITIAGTPVAGEWVQFRTYRKGTDTFSNDVILLGWMASYTTDNYSDE